MAESTNEETNSNIDLIMGDYRSSLLKLAWPMTLSMALSVVYNIADSVWVAGLGADSLAAIGFISPIFMILVGLGSGVGTGANSVMAEYIGAKDYKNASNAALHSLVLTIVISIVGAIVMYALLPFILEAMGASGVSLADGLSYGKIIFVFMIVFVYSNVATGTLRGEGDVKRAMYALAVTAILNIILDPIFIYGLGLGIDGAAWATVLSAFVSCLVLFYWTMIKKDTFIDYSPQNYKTDRRIYAKILNVAIPSTSEMVIMSGLGIVINYILAVTSGAAAVAVYTVNYRLLQLGEVPFIGIGQALLTLTGASIGAKKYRRVIDTYFYAIRIALIVSVIIAIIFYFGAPYICQIFAYGSSGHLLPEIVSSLHILCFWLIGSSLGILGSTLFQGMQKGFHSLMLTIIRAFLLEVVFSWVLAITFAWANWGVYYGVSIGCIIGGIISFLYASRYLETRDPIQEETARKKEAQSQE